jgi:hypothetical protein
VRQPLVQGALSDARVDQIQDLTYAQEAVSGILNLKSHPYKGNLDNLGDGDDPEIVEEMVHYFYHLELSPKAQFKPQTWECEVTHIGTSLAYLARIVPLKRRYFYV